MLWFAIAAALALKPGRSRRAALLGVASIGLASATANLVGKGLLRRARPDRAGVTVPAGRMVRMPGSTSFPSGHSASAFAFATAVGDVRSPAEAVGALPVIKRDDTSYTDRTVKRLWLLRHAKSSWDQPGLADADRPLAPRGQRAAAVLAAHLAASDVRPTVVLCSSSLRTRETLAAILPALGDALEIRIEQALYGAGAAQLLDRLRQVSNKASSAMLIAHNPGIQDLALALATAGPALAGLREKFPTGALTTVELDVERWRDLDHGTGTATILVTPRSLESGPES